MTAPAFGSSGLDELPRPGHVAIGTGTLEGDELSAFIAPAVEDGYFYVAAFRHSDGFLSGLKKPIVGHAVGKALATILDELGASPSVNWTYYAASDEPDGDDLPLDRRWSWPHLVFESKADWIAKRWQVDPMLSEHTGQAEPEAANPRQVSTSTPSGPDFCQISTPGILRCSFFAHARDNRPRPFSGSWETLKTGLGRVFTPQGGNPGGSPKQSMPAICPAYFVPGATRSREAAEGVSLLILDFDNACEESTGTFYPCPRTGEPSNRPKTVKVRIDEPVLTADVQAALEPTGVASIGWTTWSCTDEHPKHRWVVPLAHSIPVDLWERAATLALTMLGLDPLRRGLDVPVLHNAAALAFLPGSPDPGSIQRFETTGAALDIPLDELPALPGAILAPWQAEVVAERQAERTAGEHWFKAYRVSGRPVDFQSLDLAPLLEARGVKVGSPRPFKSGTKRRARCPWAREHSKGLDDDSVVLIETPGSWPSFKCSHSGHAHLGLRDLIEWAWGKP